jgi:hypothetical protein
MNFFEKMKAFDVKGLCVAAKFLGIKIEYEMPKGYSISQRILFLNLIEQFGLKNAKPVGTSIAGGSVGRRHEPVVESGHFSGSRV